jgi:hypothetical protein
MRKNFVKKGLSKRLFQIKRDKGKPSEGSECRMKVLSKS